MEYFNNTGEHVNNKYLRDTINQKFLEREEEAELAIAWKERRDEKAMHGLIKAYMRLVVSTANRYKHYGVPISDIIQEGNIALLSAAERFDPEKGFRFSTYAKWWVRAYIQDYILKNWSIVRNCSSTSHKQLFFNLKRLKTQLLNISTEYMDLEQQGLVAETLNVSIKDVADMEARLAHHDISLSAPISVTNDESYVDFIKDERFTPEEQTILDNTQHMQRYCIESTLDILSPKEKYIINERYLVDAPLTLEQIGAKLKVTKERVRQIENRAIRKMRYKLMERFSEIRQTML
jgi:RNA polymerase sigma-32 factor